jgi:hypothetical protein
VLEEGLAERVRQYPPPTTLQSAGDVSSGARPKLQKAIPVGRDNLPFGVSRGVDVSGYEWL